MSRCRADALSMSVTFRVTSMTADAQRSFGTCQMLTNSYAIGPSGWAGTRSLPPSPGVTPITSLKSPVTR